MPESIEITVNGKAHRVTAPPDTPLLYVLRNELGLHATKFGCGLAQCGVCSVLLDGQEVRSCTTRVADAAGRRITTTEGLPALWAEQRGAKDALHPVQQAWIEEQVPQCGYCQSGMMIQTVSLLQQTPSPTNSEVRAALDGHICRCGTHMRIMRAVDRAASLMRKG